MGVAGAALLAGLASAASADGLGRLFTTPQERTSLDEIRHQAQFAVPAPEPVVTKPTSAPQPAAPVVSRLTINGVVRRSGGTGTIWVNGDEVERGGVTREGIRVEGAERGARNVRLQLPSGISSIELKPGQEIDVLTGAVLEPYEKSSREAARATAFQAPPATPDDAVGSGAPPPAPVSDSPPPPAERAPPSGPAAQGGTGSR